VCGPSRNVVIAGFLYPRSIRCRQYRVRPTGSGESLRPADGDRIVRSEESAYGTLWYRRVLEGVVTTEPVVRTTDDRKILYWLLSRFWTDWAMRPRRLVPFSENLRTQSP